VILIDPAVTIGVDTIAGVLDAGRLTRLAGVPHGAPPASKASFIGTQTDSAGGDRLGVILVGSSIAVTIVAVAQIETRSRGARLARVPTTPVDTNPIASGSTHPHPTGGVSPFEALVAATITVLIPGVTVIVGTLGSTRLTLG